MSDAYERMKRLRTERESNARSEATHFADLAAQRMRIQSARLIDLVNILSTEGVQPFPVYDRINHEKYRRSHIYSYSYADTYAWTLGQIDIGFSDRSIEGLLDKHGAIFISHWTAVNNQPYGLGGFGHKKAKVKGLTEGPGLEREEPFTKTLVIERGRHDLSTDNLDKVSEYYLRVIAMNEEARVSRT
ncbi:hypothetical protein FOV72_20825 [Gordonia rubripertincta]|uniref:hypothetical protein n=1 Tax=Gordonia rubripertincta TaxID=36822 RepID=UPI00117CAD0F|nr:hypothetical protein [Gordonia rubripertincta]TSD93096.1 hypothetical protein FOV72_20825 [Gordonia rubripertincta]